MTTHLATVRGYKKFDDSVYESTTSYSAQVCINPTTKWKSDNGPTPGWPRQKGRANLTSSLSGFETTFFVPASCNLGSEYVNPSSPRLTHGGTFSGTLATPATSQGYMFDNLSQDNKCELKLRSSIYEIQRGVAGGVIVGELSETIRMLKRPMQGFTSATVRLANTYKKMSKLRARATAQGNRRLAKLYASGATSAWLEYAYGILPLMSDVDDIIDETNRILKKRDVQFASASCSDEKTVLHTTHKTVGGANMDVSIVSTENYSCSVRARAAVSASAAGVKIEKPRLGMRIQDFVPTIYQLIPYSFLVDYVTNVGVLMNSSFAELHWVPYSWLTMERRIDVRDELVATPINELNLLSTQTSTTPAIVGYRDVHRWSLGDETEHVFYVVSDLSSRKVGNVTALLLNKLASIK